MEGTPPIVQAPVADPPANATPQPVQTPAPVEIVAPVTPTQPPPAVSAPPVMQVATPPVQEAAQLTVDMNVLTAEVDKAYGRE